MARPGRNLNEEGPTLERASPSNLMLMLRRRNTRRDKSSTDKSRLKPSSTASVGVFAKFDRNSNSLLYQTQALWTPHILVGGASNANHTYMPGGVLNHPVEGIVPKINQSGAN